MTLAKINRSYNTRTQVVSRQVTDTNLTAAANNQSFDFLDSVGDPLVLPTGAILVAEWIDVDEVFESTGTATAATKTGTNSETYAMTDGMTVLVDVDNAGEDTATFNFTAGTQECTTYFPVSDLDGLTLNVSVDGAADQLVTFATPCTTSAHVRAQIAAQTTGLAVSQATTGKAAYIPTNTENAPFDLGTNGLTAICDVDDAGADTATWVAVAAVSNGSGLAIVNIDGETLTLQIDGGSTQTITFGAGDVDADTAAATINAQLVGGWAEVDTGEIDIYSDTLGTLSEVNITGGTARAELGHAIADNTEATSSAVNCRAATIAEIKTWLEAAWTGSSGVTITDIGGNRFSVTSGTADSDSELDIQASTAIATLGLAVQTVVGTEDQPKLTSDEKGTGSSIAVVDVDSGLTWGSAVAGTGDAVLASAVTAAEVAAVLTTDIQGATSAASGGDFSITSNTTGASSELDFGAGTANTVLGLTDETIVGTDATDGTATADVGEKGGDVDAYLDGANITTATGAVNLPKGVQPNGDIGGITPQVKIISNINVDLLDQGDCTAYLMYHVQAGNLDSDLQ